MTTTTQHDVVIIGAGVAGLSAARAALRAGLSVAYIEGQMFGGLILNVNELDGAITGSGAEFASNLMMEVLDAGGADIDGVVTHLTIREGEFVVHSGASDHRAKAVIVASGAARRTLGVPGEEEFFGRGVSHCADCDGPMFGGQDVMVVGGGDSALQSAVVLARFCRTVHLVHRGISFTAREHLRAAAAGMPNIQCHFGAQVEEILGGTGVEGARVNGKVIPCTGFFAYIGLDAMTAFLPPDVARDEHGALRTGDGFETNVPGLFAVGAVRADYEGMIEHAIAEGEAAGSHVAKHIHALASM